MAMDKADKKTIGITTGNERILAALTAEGLFALEIDAAKFAMSHAIEQGVQRGTVEGTGTKWNVGSFDQDGAVKAIVEALFLDEVQPYRLVEYLINEGLALLDQGSSLPPDVAGLLLTRKAS